MANKPFFVYLSSTLTDLEEERGAVTDALNGMASVKQSYNAHEHDLTTSCIEDVRDCQVYVGVIGLRYGFVPPGESLSITQLEYEAAQGAGLACFIFIKSEESIVVKCADKDRSKVDEFRALLSSGKRSTSRPAVFRSKDDLKYEVIKAIAEWSARSEGISPQFSGRRNDAAEIKYDLSIGLMPGTDDVLKEALVTAITGKPRVSLFDLSPERSEDYLSVLDNRARQSHAVMLAITDRSLARIYEQAALVSACVRMIKKRSSQLSCLLVNVAQADLPVALRDLVDGCFISSEKDWSDDCKGTAARLDRWRRERAPRSAYAATIGVPYMVVALNAKEVAELDQQTLTIFGSAGDEATRRAVFEDLRQRMQQLHPTWPSGFYGQERQDWKPFDLEAPNLNELVLAAARKIDRAQEGSRERRMLQNATLILQAYSFDEYLVDRYGSRENIQQVCGRGCLILIDELALLHPRLRGRIDELLAYNNVSAVAISACDPARGPLRLLLDTVSHMRVGNLVPRFSQFEDLRCEIALNSVERLQRWLRLVIPELIATLGYQHSSPSLVARSGELFTESP